MNDYEKRRVDVEHGEKGKKVSGLNDSARAVYYYLLAKSTWNLSHNEDHYYIRKRDINKSDISKQLGYSRTTIYKSLDLLKAKNKIWEDENYYIFPLPKPYTTMRQEVLRYLIGYFKIFSSDIIWLLAILKSIPESERKQGFNASELVYILERYPNRTTRANVRAMLYILQEDEFIKMRSVWTTNNSGVSYYVYKFDEVNTEYLPIQVDKESPIDVEKCDRVKAQFLDGEQENIV